jgi:hypothetical protein
MTILINILKTENLSTKEKKAMTRGQKCQSYNDLAGY